MYVECCEIYYMCFVYNLLIFSTVKNFESRLGFDKLSPSVVVHFLGHSIDRNICSQIKTTKHTSHAQTEI